MRKIGIGISVSLFLFSGFFIYNSGSTTSKKFNELNVLLDGAQTCFMRVNQTYSAKMIGLDSSYLKNSFFRETENCYKDLSIRLI